MDHMMLQPQVKGRYTAEVIVNQSFKLNLSMMSIIDKFTTSLTLAFEESKNRI
jgi:hypothetical protein